jgi:predicted RNA-binding protein (virulence factor B family)
MELGKYNLLKAYRKTEHGFYLADEEGSEVLLPNAYVTETLEILNTLEVFVYKDSDDRPVATTLRPLITLNEFAVLMVKHINSNGAFMDWALPKDLLVPFSEQPYSLKEGESYVIYLYEDQITNRLVGSAHIDKYLDNSEISYKAGDEVDLLVYEITELGYKVIVDGKSKGLIYKNEVYIPIRIGDRRKGFISKIREENKIDISLQKFGYRNVASNVDRIHDYLKNNKGYLSLTDKSSPDEIVEILGMSKKTYKKAIGDLYKKRIIRLESDGIYLI